MSWRRGHKGRVDENQSAIFEVWRKAGATVLPLSGIGDGAPDALVGFHGVDQLAEIKNPKQPPAKRKLRPRQETFRQEWRGRPVVVVESVEDALAVIGVNRGVGR